MKDHIVIDVHLDRESESMLFVATAFRNGKPLLQRKAYTDDPNDAYLAVADALKKHGLTVS